MITPAGRMLVELGSRKRLVRLYYRRLIFHDQPEARIVEPYNLTEGTENIMVRCYQRQPDAGWRFFMLSKIDLAEDAGEGFHPRTRITLDPDAIGSRTVLESDWATHLRHYRDLVGEALADGRVTTEEQQKIQQFAMDNNISLQQIRAVHATIFHQCLGAILDDGVVDSDERAQLQFLDRVLRSLGWSVTDG